jgi:Protein of unknown function (DUF1573)
MARLLRILEGIALPVGLAMLAIVFARLWTTHSPARLLIPDLVSVEPPKVVVHAAIGEAVLAEFKVRNETSEPIKLLGYNCDCTCVNINEGLPAELAPGASADLKVRMTAGRSATGTYAKEITLLANRAGPVPPLIVEAILPSPVPSQ